MVAEYNFLPREGDSLGPYDLIKVLSTSILGNFYLATHRAQNEQVLIHLIPESLLQADPQFYSTYQTAIEQQKQVPKGPVLAVTEMTRISGQLVVRYEGGHFQSVTEAVSQARNPLPEEQVRRFLRSMAVGLSDGAKIGQGHCFLTPDFLFIDGTGEIRIAGIGLFESIQYEAFERFVSGAIMPIKGDKDKNFSAIEILSPEIRNDKVRDPRSDFYCIGMCAYFMLIGHKPSRRWEIPSMARKGLHGGWDLFLSHCLEPKPADRFPHYRGFLRDLENIEQLTNRPRKESGQLMRILEYIPLPKKLEEEWGMRPLLVLRLGMLGLAGLLALLAAYLFLQILFTDISTQDASLPIKKVADQSSANLIIEIGSPRALVMVSGPESGRFIVFGDTLFLQGRSGRYRVEVSAPQRKTERFEIDLMASEPVRKYVELAFAFTSVRFEGVIGTEVYVELESGLPVYLGSIDSPDGLLLEDRLLGHDFTFLGRHPSYQTTRSESVNLDQPGQRVQFRQTPLPSELVLRSDPSGASVYLDGVLVGLTPLRLEGLSPHQAHVVELKKPGFRTVTQSFELSLGESRHFDAGKLVERLGRVTYAVDFPGEWVPPLEFFAFSLNGDPLPFQRSGEIVLPEGNHTLHLEHPDYFPFKEDFLVEDDAVTSISLAMQARPMRVRPVVETDSLVRFKVDDEAAELTEDGFLLVPPLTSAKVEAIIRDFHSVIQRFEGQPNQETEWRIPLKSLPSPEFGEDYSPPYFPMPMVWIEPSRFVMGSPINEYRRLPNEDNRTTVRLEKGYWIGKFEITQDTYTRVMGENPSRFKGESLPVDSVTWQQANQFCERLTEFERNGQRLPEGYLYRLPTEAEWEYAARAGTESAFSFGDTGDPTMGNFHGFYTPGQSVGMASESSYGTRPIGSYPPNAFGLHDVHGNVAEWSLDRHWDRHPGGIVSDPHNDRRGRGYTIRGGSWQSTADRVRSAAREGVPANANRNTIGFRVVLAPAIVQ